MYPSKELEELEKRKWILTAKAAVLRAECCVSGGIALKPLQWIDTARRTWTQFLPLVGLGALFFSHNRIGRRLGILGLVLRWGPKLWRVFREFRQQVQEDAPAPAPAP